MSVKRLFLLLALTATPAAAHDRYPWDCCSGMDCAPVDKAVLLPDSAMMVTTKHGTTIVPATFPKRDSQDNRMHVCMRPADGGMKTICIFFPPAT